MPCVRVAFAQTFGKMIPNTNPLHPLFRLTRKQPTMDLLSRLESNNYRPKDTTISAVWAPEEIVYDVTVLLRVAGVPKFRENKETGAQERDGEQLKIRGLVNADTKGLKVQRGQWVDYPAGTEVNLYIDAGAKSDAVIAALKAVGAKDIEPLSRLIIQQKGFVEPAKSGQSPKKLYLAWYYPPSSAEALAAPYLAHCGPRSAELQAEEAKFAKDAAPAVPAGPPVPMAGQPAAPLPTPAAAPMAAPVTAAPVAAAAAPVAAAAAAPAQPTLANLLGTTS